MTDQKSISGGLVIRRFPGEWIDVHKDGLTLRIYFKEWKNGQFVVQMIGPDDFRIERGKRDVGEIFNDTRTIHNPMR